MDHVNIRALKAEGGKTGVPAEYPQLWFVVLGEV